jgi:Uma2 family endonuclease
MIIEITSPSTTRHDRLTKFHQYLKAGVREYWIIDPDSKTVSVHILEKGNYITKAYGDTDTVPVHILSGYQINMEEVFDFPDTEEK